MQRRRVLLIAYQFPPVLGGGTFRPLKFAKYLPQFGWDPVVLCANPSEYDKVDLSLLKELPSSVLVEYVSYLHPKRMERNALVIWQLLWKLRLRPLARRMEPYMLLRWIFPDPYILWARAAFRTAGRLLKQVQPDVILTTSPPHSTQLVGLWLKHATGLPWVADLRDPWTTNPFVNYPTHWHLKLNKTWEARMFREADWIVSATQMMTDEFGHLYGESSAAKIGTIPNGFDPEDFGHTKCQPPSPRMRLVYTGSLYGIQKPDMFLASIDRLISNGMIPLNDLSVQFIGSDAVGTLTRYRDRTWLQHVGPQSHEYVIKAIESADVLLLLIPPEGAYIHSGKLFEYLAASRPILALAPAQSEAEQIVRKAKVGVVAAPDDEHAIADAVMQLYREWKSGTLQVTPDRGIIASFDRCRLTEELASVLNQLASSDRPRK